MDDEQQRFAALFDEHHDAVLAFLLRRSQPPEAEELAAETFVVAWQQFDEHQDLTRPWLFAVARRLLGNHNRSQARRAAATARAVRTTRSEDAVAGDPAAAVVARTTALEALASLNPSDQEVIRLVAWDGLEPAAAAVVLGCSIAAFKVRLHRARRRLEDAMLTVSSGQADPGRAGDAAQTLTAGAAEAIPDRASGISGPRTTRGVLR